MLYFASWKDDFNPDNLHMQDDYDNFASPDLNENEFVNHQAIDDFQPDFTQGNDFTSWVQPEVVDKDALIPDQVSKK